MRTIIPGPPGTGKTHRLIHTHLRHELLDLKTDSKKIAFDYLDGPVELVASCDCPPPMAPTLEAAFMPNAQKVCERVTAMLNIKSL